MPRHLAALAVAVLLATGCTEPQRWEERGFPSEEACWRHHGWVGPEITTSDVQRYDFWCGPIEDD